MPRARLRLIALVSGCLLAAAVLSGRQSTIIIGDGISLSRDATPPPKGTGVVMGRTVDAVSGKPIGEVVVTLSLTAPPFSGYLAVVSDDQGRFVVRDLPRGPFRFYAVKPGYIPGGYSKRQLAAEEDRFGSSMNLNDAERALDVTITLWKHGVIEGTVTDEIGDPIVGTTVRAVPRRVVAGRSQFAFETNVIPFGIYTARTDDRGMYRLDSLPPGDYVVAVPVIIWSAPKARPASANVSPTAATSSSSTGLLSWTSGGRGGGTGVANLEAGDELFGLVNLNAQWATPPMLAGFTPQGRPLVYETQYFPGSTTLGRASVVALGSGDTRSAVDFRLRPTPALKIAGVASGPSGPMPNLTLRLVSGEMSSTSGDPEVGITTTDGEGRFVFLGVTPGQYAVRVVDVPRPQAAPLSTAGPVQVSGGRGTTIFAGGSSRATVPTAPVLSAETLVSLTDRDIKDVVVTLRPGARIRGRVEFDGTAARPDPPRPWVSLVRADGQRAINYQLTDVFADEQWQIGTNQQVPGQYVIRPSGSPPGWYFVGAFAGTRDISIQPLDLGNSDVDNVVIKYSDKPLGSITGTITNGQGAPDTKATAIIFPADRALWTNYGPSPRMLRAAGTGRAGRFNAEGLPAGEYLAAAVANMPLGGADPKFLEMLARTAAHVTLRDRENATVDLRVTAVAAAPPTADEPRPAGHGPFVQGDSESAELSSIRPTYFQQTRDATPAAIAAGSGRIAGMISLDTEGRRPAPRVTVTLIGGTPSVNRTAITTETGRFDFGGLTAGRYTLAAGKPAYLNAAYGATRIGGPGTPIALTDGQQMANLVIAIRKGAVITGVIRDERGQPMPGASVQIHEYRMVTGERRLMSTGAEIRTDDRGVYRAFGLQPADYYVSAAANYVTGTARLTTAADIQFAQQPASAAAGPGSSASGPVSSPAASASSAAVRKYVPVLYPGAFTIDGATTVKVGVAEERSGIDFALRMVPAITVQGAVVGSGPLPPNVQVRLVSVSEAVTTTGVTDLASILPMRVGTDGQFSFSGVAPGQYVVAAVTQAAAARGGRGAAEDPAPSSGFWGMAPVDVNGVDVSNVIVTLQAGMTVSGRVRFNGTTLAAPADLSAIRVFLSPVLTGGQIAMGQTSANAGPDGSFTFTGLTPGRYNLRATATGMTGWLMSSISAAGQDAIDMPFELKSGATVTDASIVFGDRPAELSGTFEGASGRAATDYYVVLLPADPAKWRSTNRRVQQVRPAIDGKFTFRNLLPGDWVLAAATDLEPGIPSDPDLLAELARSGTKVTIAEGEKKVQNLGIR